MGVSGLVVEVRGKVGLGCHLFLNCGLVHIFIVVIVHVSFAREVGRAFMLMWATILFPVKIIPEIRLLNETHILVPPDSLVYVSR